MLTFDIRGFLELFVSTAGSVLYLFLLTLFAGLRRRKAFEVTLFLAGIAVFLFFVAPLLAFNVAIYYARPPYFTWQFAKVLFRIALLLLPALCVHAHIEYLKRVDARSRVLLDVLAATSYVGLLAAAPKGTYALVFPPSEYFFRADPVFGALTSLAFGISALMELTFVRRSSLGTLRSLHWGLGITLLLVAVFWPIPSIPALLIRYVLLIPGLLLGILTIRNRLLLAGFQRSLVFSVTGGFIALLYLTLLRRISDWLEPYFPPVATTSVLLFVLVIFFDTMQRRIGGVLQRAFRAEAEQLQRLTAEIQHVARAGNLAELIRFAETRIRDSFALSGVRISLNDAQPGPANLSGNVQRFVLRNGPAEIGVLEAYFFGQSLSGETHAALDYLAEQLPAAIDLCRLLDEKLRLERELAERERLALLGQMAASISHNLRNPLSAMKTLLQLQLENPELPASARPDCEKAIAEVDRLNAKLTQLLRYAKPAVRAGRGADTDRVDAAAVAARTVALLQHDAERRGVALTLDGPSETLEAAGTEEALSDVLSNLIVNAMEAVPPGGAVRVTLARSDSAIALKILDDGPGIPEYVRPRIFQPFFTTKPSGTGLGLAIVEKRLAEIGATIECESPVRDARGTRFVVTLRRAPDSSRGTD